MNVSSRSLKTAHGTERLKSRHELETVNQQQPVENSQLAENVAKVVGATSSEGFLIRQWICFVDSYLAVFTQMRAACGCWIQTTDCRRAWREKTAPQTLHDSTIKVSKLFTRRCSCGSWCSWVGCPAQRRRAAIVGHVAWQPTRDRNALCSQPATRRAPFIPAHQSAGSGSAVGLPRVLEYYSSSKLARRQLAREFMICPSVTSRCSAETAKRRVTQTTPRDSPGTIVF